jgi:hypothetical protein
MPTHDDDTPADRYAASGEPLTPRRHEPPVRIMAMIGRLIEETVAEAIAEHKQADHQPPTCDEPPVAAIAGITSALNELAEDAAGDALKRHLQEHHPLQVEES